MSPKKQKGGAEKIREKYKKSLELDALKCAKISDMFSPRAQSSSDPMAGPSREATNFEQTTTEEDLVEYVDETSEFSTEEHRELGHTELPGKQAIVDVSECQTEDMDTSFNYFARPNKNELGVFFKYHPRQDIPDPTLKKATKRKDGTSRKWLTYCKEKKAMFCSVCLAFSKSQETNSFIEGMTDKRHVHQRIEEHEKSVMHNVCAEAFFLKSSSAGVEDLLLYKQMSVRREQVRNRRQVLQRVVDVVKVIGKQGLSYRGDKDEAAYNLEDITKDHGNFLELILLVSKYDMCLKDHVSKCIENSKKLQSSGGKGRGSLITLLSKTTVNKVIQAIRMLIQENISKEVREAGMFSIQIDTTQDITSKDQCSIIVRYVTDCINEKLLAVVECESSTGQNLFKLLTEVLKSCKLNITNCIGNSTDGAANMQGQYNGFSSWLSTESPGQIHIWCYAHILNLVLADTTKVVVESASLFSLLNDIAVFIRDSYQRMNTWEKVSQDPHHRRISVIGETRWWSKDAALRKVFGEFSNPDSALFHSLLYTLSRIEENVSSKPEARVRAKSYAESLLKYETILTAQIFLRIFELTTPLSKYLQTTQMDISKAIQMVQGTYEKLKTITRDFDSIQMTADKFVKWANDKIQEEESYHLEVQTTLPQKRIRKRKRMADETDDDVAVCDAVSAYKIRVHNVILDTVTESMNRRFLSCGTLYADLACLEPNSFSDIKKSGLQAPAMEELSKRLVRFDEGATSENLRSQLASFAMQWDRLKTSPLEVYTIVEDVSMENQESKLPETELVNKSCMACKNCAICCYKILQRYNLLTDAYNVIGLAYKFLLSLSFTQVACERSFSTLKFIKTRLRSSVSQEHLSSLMLMAIEKDILMNLDSDDVIDRVAETSELLRNLLNP